MSKSVELGDIWFGAMGNPTLLGMSSPTCLMLESGISALAPLALRTVAGAALRIAGWVAAVQAPPTRCWKHTPLLWALDCL